jgi:outer membrane protein assembly factor BamB
MRWFNWGGLFPIIDDCRICNEDPADSGDLGIIPVAQLPRRAMFVRNEPNPVWASLTEIKKESLVIRQLSIIAVAVVLFGTIATARAERLVLASASYGKNVVAIVDLKGKVVWSHKTSGGKGGHAGHHDIQLLGNGNILFHDNWTVTKEMKLDGTVVWEYDSAKMNGNKGKRVGVHAFQRLANGHTMIVESGVGRIIEVDKDGKIHVEVKMADDRKQSRMGRKIANGNYLICTEGKGVTEYNAKSEIVWKYDTRDRVYGATRLKSGNTLIALGSGNGYIEVTPKGETVWEMKKTVPGTEITLHWTTSVVELPNGNFYLGNCHAKDKNPQMLEVTRDKKVVWQINRYDLFGNGLACSQILDEKQSAMVRKLLANSGK